MTWNTDGGRPIRVGGVDALPGPDNSAWLLMPFPDMTWYGGR